MSKIKFERISSNHNITNKAESRRLFCIIVMIVSLVISFVAVSEARESRSKSKSQPQLNDPLCSKQQALFDKINVLEAWNTTKGDPNILVGIVDFGFDFFHPDLKENLVPGFYASGGYHTECYGIVAHGTLVASIIAAKDNNKIGMTGLAPRCRVLTASYGMIENKYGSLLRKFRQDHPEALPGDKRWAKIQEERGDEMEDFGTK